MSTSANSNKRNILLVIADDLGADNVLVTDRSPLRQMYVATDAGVNLDLLLNELIASYQVDDAPTLFSAFDPR